MSVTAPRGFRAAGVTGGLKQSGERDVAVDHGHDSDPLARNPYR